MFRVKATLISMLASVPDESNLIISGIKSDFIDSDILDILHDFVESGKYRGITTTLVNIEGKNWTTRMNS